jgi:hypothetical protein
MFRATMDPSSGETTVFMRHLVLVILYGWLSGMQGGSINTVVSPDDGHTVTRNVRRKEINVLRKIAHQVGFIYKMLQGRTVNRTYSTFLLFDLYQLPLFFLLFILLTRPTPTERTRDRQWCSGRKWHTIYVIEIRTLYVVITVVTVLLPFDSHIGNRQETAAYCKVYGKVRQRA